jgi:hypothetical protein
MEENIRNLTALVDAAAKKIAVQVAKGDTKGLKELLWNVPVKVLAEFLTREG